MQGMRTCHTGYRCLTSSSEKHKTKAGVYPTPGGLYPAMPPLPLWCRTVTGGWGQGGRSVCMHMCRCPEEAARAGASRVERRSDTTRGLEEGRAPVLWGWCAPGWETNIGRVAEGDARKSYDCVLGTSLCLGAVPGLTGNQRQIAKCNMT